MKLVKSIFIAIFIATVAYAGQIEKDGNGLYYNKLFFDYNIAGVDFYEYISYSNRKGFHLSNNILATLNSSLKGKHSFKITGLIKLHESLNTADILVKTNIFNTCNGKNNKDGFKLKEDAFYIKINDKNMNSKIISTKCIRDSLGNAHIKFEIIGVFTESKYWKTQVYNIIKKIKIEIAPKKKKRGQNYAWKTPKFYVIEE